MTTVDTGDRTTTPPRRYARGATRVLPFAPALLLIGLALGGPLLAPHRIDAPVTGPYAGPSGAAPLGGDQLGRDVLSRLLAGGPELLLTSALIGVVVTALAALLGTVAALRPAFGRVIERAADLTMLLPTVLALLLVALSWPGGGRLALVAAAVVMGLPYAVRMVAAAATPIATAGFVDVAVASGERLWHLVWREVLPNLRATVLTLLGLRFVAAVYVVTTAGFLEIGPQPPAANWALMVRENAPGVLLNPWAVIAPSLAIGALAVGVTLAADALTRTVTAPCTRRPGEAPAVMPP